MKTSEHFSDWSKVIVKKGSLYVLSSVITKGFAFFLMPLYTKYLSTSDYGLLSNLNAIAGVMPIFISLYIDSAFGRYYFESNKNHRSLAELFSTVYWFVFFYGGIIVLLVLLSTPFWFTQSFGIPLRPYIFITFIPCLLNQLAQLGSVFMMQSLDVKKRSSLDVSSTIINGVVSIILLVYFKLGVESRLWGSFAAASFLLIFYTFYFVKEKILIFFFSKTILKKCLIYSLPLLPNIASGWIVSISDRLLITRYSGLSASGVYSFAANLTLLLYAVQDAITQVQGPLAMSGLIEDKDTAKLRISKFIELSLFVMLLAHFSLALFSREILFVIVKLGRGHMDYLEAYKYVGILGLVNVITTQNRNFSVIISYIKKTWVLSSAGIIAAILSVVMNVTFLPRFGSVAASYIFVISNLISLSWIVFWAQKYEPIPLRKKRIVINIFIYLVMLVVSSKYLMGTVSIANFLVKFFIVAIYAIYLILLHTVFNKKVD